MPSDESPLFLFGVGHSGTTMLHRMLGYHPRLVWLSQFSLRSGEIPGRERRWTANHLDVLLRRIPYRWQKEQSVIDRVVPRPEEFGSAWEYLLREDAKGAPRLRSFLLSFSEQRGGLRVLAKWNQFPTVLPSLHTAFPEARFVHLVRDGRAVALSLRAKRLVSRTVWTEANGVVPVSGDDLEPDRLLRSTTTEWYERVGRVAEASGLDLLEVRYEDLCDDVHGILTSIFDHAGVDAREFPYGRCPTTLANRNQRRFDAASMDELRTMSAIQAPLLARYGYPSSTDRSTLTGRAIQGRGASHRR